MLLDNAFTPGVKKAHLLLLEHDLTRSTIPTIRDLIQKDINPTNIGTKTVILMTLLHPPSVFVRHHPNTRGVSILENDYTNRTIELDSLVPKLDIKVLRNDLMQSIEAGGRHFSLRNAERLNIENVVSPNDSLTVIIDSIDLLATDIGSDSSTLALLQATAERIKARKCELNTFVTSPCV